MNKFLFILALSLLLGIADIAKGAQTARRGKDSTEAEFIKTVITSGGGGTGGPNYDDCVSAVKGMIADSAMIAYFHLSIGHFDIYINGKSAATGRDTSLDGYDQRQWTGLLSEGDVLTWSGACSPKLVCRMNK